MSRTEEDDVGLLEGQRELVENMRRVALDTIGEGKPLSGVAELRLSEYFRELFCLRNRRNRAVGRGDLGRADELQTELDALLCDLKQIGVPYHPAFGNRDDWRRLDAPDLPGDGRGGGQVDLRGGWSE